MPADEQLRALAAAQGIELSDEDLEGVRSFLDVFLPALARLHELLPPDAPGPRGPVAGSRVSLVALARALRSGELSPAEAVATALRRIEELDGSLNAFISVRPRKRCAEAGSPQRRARCGVCRSASRT